MIDSSRARLVARELRPASTLAAMPNVARVIAVAGAMLLGLALTGCTGHIDPVIPDAARPTTPAAAPTPTSEAEAAAEPTACQDQFSAELLWNPESEVPVTATIQLTNEGAAPCDLTGFPAVSSSSPTATR